MILCDIGNSYYHFYDKGHMWRISVNDKPSLAQDKFLHVVSVNSKAFAKLQKLKYKLINLQDYLKLNSSYAGLGADRAFACYAVNDGIIVDAGSAITIDVVSNGFHLGGFILPGIISIQKAYAASAKVLDRKFNFGISLDLLPQNTVDAISYGAIGSVILMIKNISKGKKIYFTGGDGAYLSKFFDEAVVDETLIFKGMLKVIDQYGLDSVNN